MFRLGCWLLLVAVLAGLAALVFGQLRPQMVVSQAQLPVNFAHIDHRATNCLQCHHNFADTTGTLPCFECHKTDDAVKHLIETQFHDLCRGCHVEQRQLGEPAGPVRQCIDCHQEDPFP